MNCMVADLINHYKFNNASNKISNRENIHVYFQ